MYYSEPVNNSFKKFLYSTVRIYTTKSVEETYYATGFFFKPQNRTFPLLICNKHHMESATSSTVYFHIANKDGAVTNNEYELNVNNILDICMFHNDENNDLCIIMLDGLLNFFQKENVDIYFTYLTSDMIPSDTVINNLSPIKDIYFIGYPDELYDKYNKLPIIRNGITATQYKFDYNGTSTFLIDASVYGGSSGSPVVCIENDKILFLGFQKRVHNHNIGCFTDSISLSINIPNGLGLVSKSTVLRNINL